MQDDRNKALLLRCIAYGGILALVWYVGSWIAGVSPQKAKHSAACGLFLVGIMLEVGREGIKSRSESSGEHLVEELQQTRQAVANAHPSMVSLAQALESCPAPGQPLGVAGSEPTAAIDVPVRVATGWGQPAPQAAPADDYGLEDLVDDRPSQHAHATSELGDLWR